MTTQEFVKQEVEAASNKMFPIGNEHESKMIASQEYRNGMAYGLTKGLDIAKEYSVWKENNYVKVWDKYCHRHSDISEKRLHLTNEQLLTIFLTEKYENNG